MSLRSPESTSFPFLSLPSEIRNMIYHYLFHKPASITLTKYRNQVSRVILPINFLVTNSQICHEACSIFYHHNVLIMDYNSLHDKLWPMCRTDIDTPNSTKLRSGRVIPSSRFEGLIYAHVLHRFRNLGLCVSWFNYSNVDDLQGIYIAKVLKALCSSPLVTATTAELTGAPCSLPLLACVPVNSASQCKFFILKLHLRKFSDMLYAEADVQEQVQEFLLKHSILKLTALLAHNLNRQLVIDGPYGKGFIDWCNGIVDGVLKDEGKTTIA